MTTIIPAMSSRTDRESKEASPNLPAVFVSHGAPTLAVEENDTTGFLNQLRRELRKPGTILCVSAHWGTSEPVVSAAEMPQTIHVFGGFPEGLYRINYPAPRRPFGRWSSTNGSSEK
jgi:4,5-DOPA dioxygenase extradiol